MAHDEALDLVRSGRSREHRLQRPASLQALLAEAGGERIERGTESGRARALVDGESDASLEVSSWSNFDSHRASIVEPRSLKKASTSFGRCRTAVGRSPEGDESL